MLSLMGKASGMATGAAAGTEVGSVIYPVRQLTAAVSGLTRYTPASRVDVYKRQVSVNLLTNSMVVESDAPLEQDVIVKAVEHAGYGASPADGRAAGPAAKPGGAPAQNPMQAQLKNMRMRLWVSFAFLAPLMYVSMGSMAGLPLPGFLTGHENAVGFALTQLLLTLPVVYVNRKYYEVGFKTLLRGSPNMDSLIAIGSTAALVYGVFAIYRIGYGLGAVSYTHLECENI